MAYISKRGDFYRLEIRRRGYKPTYRTFDSRKQAEQCARLIKSKIDAGNFIDQSEAKRTTLAEALERYKREIASIKSHPAQENYRIEKWKMDFTCFCRHISASSVKLLECQRAQLV